MSTPSVRPDILFVNPGNRGMMYQSKSYAKSHSAKEPPVWVGLLAKFMQKAGFSVEVLDANCEDLFTEETVKRIHDINPVLTALVVYGHNPSASTQVMPSAGEIAREVKKLHPEHRLIHVGGHVSALPERTLREEHADFVASGEGMYTLNDLVLAIKAGETDFQKVRGLWWWKDGQVQANAPAPLMQNLNEEMPGMALDLLPMHLYRAHDWHCFGDIPREPYLAMYTTLGCPFHCDFCCIQSPFKEGERASGMKPDLNSYRFWDPKIVLEQIAWFVEKMGGKNIKFADEMFFLNRRHIGAIFDAIIERGYDLNIWCYSRIDTFKDERIIESSRRAGVRWECFGIEAGAHDVRAQVDKDFTQESIYDAIAMCNKHNIYVLANYIFGLPDDTTETMQATLDLSLDLNTEFGNMYATMAYPGSKLYYEAVKNGWPLPKTWMGYSQHSKETLPLPTKTLTGEQVLDFKNRAFHGYLTYPSYHALVRRTFGEKTVEHIKSLAEIYAERIRTGQREVTK